MTKLQTINERIGIILEKTGMSRTAFGGILKVSQQYISKLIKSGTPSERLIDDICEKIKINNERINKHWLLTGEGEITIKLTRNQEIFDFANKVMELPDKSIKKKLVLALSKLTDDDWNRLIEIAEEVFSETESGKENTE